ncbi:CrcB-like protein-domain-containing protein [Gautieria morchelliformis]|nr:CrcB-like protein-domain-containing protein [Gautieria morchelliformis]
MDGLTRSLFTLAASLASFALGKQLGKRTASRLPALPHLPSALKWLITILSIALYALTIPFFVRLNHSWRPLATAALLLSFPGTLTRYVLSTQLNTRLHIFPLGTLIANEFATAVLAACHIIQRAPSPPPPVACSILQGIIDGFCGCLSTVSTFVVELRTLRGKKAWIYFLVSFILAQIILLLILGPAWWTGRIRESDICTFG